MTPDATARLVALPDSLRAWARQDPRVRLHLSAHVTAGVPLGHVLARLGQALGEEGDWEVRRRLEEGVTREKFQPWCSRLLPDGLRCRALTTVLVQLPTGGAVERCADCARWHQREGTGRALRALAAR
ncbi:MAG: hypothetical protein EPO40_16665 [Myxococcaceae bacterium]|nr:MAG: hypothetical protein EPO40_16665 [Myxococcaceae bacterium]